jgi:hypothetical protein
MFHYSQTRKTIILHEEQYTLLVISRSFLLIMRNVSEKVVEKITTHFMFSYFFPEDSLPYEIMWKHFAVLSGTQLTLWPMRNVCCIPKAAHTKSEYLMFCGPCIVIYLRNKNLSVYTEQYLTYVTLRHAVRTRLYFEQIQHTQPRPTKKDNMQAQVSTTT